MEWKKLGREEGKENEDNAQGEEMVILSYRPNACNV
jgi:hypothetical protein